MIARFHTSPVLKAHKVQESPPAYFTSCRSTPDKIMPMPMIYRKIQNDKKMRQKLVALGYKHFSKLAACGEDTPLTLENACKSNNIKYIRKLEFDPYLCEKSHIKPFKEAIKKFREIRDINLVIRRLDWMNESDILSPYFSRLTKLRKMRLEMTNIEKLNDDGVIKLAWATGKLYTVRECEQIMTGTEQISQYAGMHFAKYGKRLRMCKKFKKTLQKACLVTKPDASAKTIEEDFVKKTRNCDIWKDICFKVCMPPGWLSMSTDIDESAAVNLRMITAQTSLEKLCLHFGGNPLTLETIQCLSAALPNLPKLRTFGLEFLNSRVSEMEVVIFAQTLPNIKSLERLTFKVIQYPGVSEGCIFYLMSTISKLSNLKQFDIYFRRLSISGEIIEELLRRIDSLDNIQYSYCKQSLYFYRTDKK